MQLVEIVESYVAGVYILKETGGLSVTRVGPLGRLLGEADRWARGHVASVVVLDRHHTVTHCRRYRPGFPVVVEDKGVVRW